MSIKKLMQKSRSIFSKEWALVLILFLISFGVYSNIIQNGFAWDDKDFIINWPSIKSIGDRSPLENLPSLLSGEIPEDHRGVYRPVRSFFYLISYQIWGQTPMGYHIQALLIHTAIVILIFFIVLKISNNKLLAFLVSSLFATHPIHTEAISYITASFDTLGILFFFAAFYLYLLSRVPSPKQTAYKILSLIYTLVCFFTYEMTLILPFLIIFYDYCFGAINRNNIFERIKVYKNYFTILLFYVLTRVLWLQIGNRGYYFGEFYIVISKQARLETPQIIAEYLQLLINPQKLTVNHPLPTDLVSLFLNSLSKLDHSGTLINIVSATDIFIPLFGISILLFLFIKLFKYHKMWLFALGWFLIALLPVSNLIPQGATITERFLYIPSFGFSLATGLIFSNLLKKTGQGRASIHRWIFIFVILIFCTTVGYYAYRSNLRNSDWKNEKTIWLSALKVDPKDSLATSNLGLIYYREGQYDTSIDLFNRSIQNSPDNLKNHYNLALAYEKKGDITSAINENNEALNIDRNYYPSMISLGNIYQNQNNYKLAIDYYNKVDEISPQKADFYLNFGDLYKKSGLDNLALEKYKKAISINPYFSQAYNNIGIIYGDNKDYATAEKLFLLALDLKSNNPKTYFNLGHIYEIQGKIELAIKQYQNGLSLMPGQKEIEEKLTKLRQVNFKGNN